MNKTENLNSKIQGKKSSNSIGIDPITVFNLLKRNWYWFVIGILAGIICARFYSNHTLPVYQTSASILINETESRPLVDNTALLQGLGLPGGMENLENQMMILRSRELIETTLHELPFEMEFYFKTFRNKLPIYPDIPIWVRYNNENPLPKNIEFSLDFTGDNGYILESQDDNYPLNVGANFGDSININGSSLTIGCFDLDWFRKNSNRRLYFINHSWNRLVNHFSRRMTIERISRGGTILKISLIGTNPVKDADFINKQLEGFQNISLDKKNIEAERRIQFIDDQLIGISDSLITTENRLQQFRSAHQVTDLSAQGQALIAQVTALENERARLNLEANYYDYLAEYLTKNTSNEMPIVPITMGISDPGLSRLVEELAELQGQLSLRGAGEMNPLQRNLEHRIKTTKEALSETLNGLKRANSLARVENQQQLNRINSRASALPATERQLLGIERRFKLNDELYTFLLETRAEQQMQKASNRADSEIVEKADARYSSRIAPDSTKIQYMGIIAGVGLPFIIIFLLFLLNKRINIEEIHRICDLPVVGEIPHNKEGSNTVVFSNPDSPIAEAFRLIRSKMQFLTKEAGAPVILVTSSMPGEGKTHSAINLASVYSLLGKRTILLGFDLRKPKLFQDFNLSNEKGISTWLIGKDKLQDVIQETGFSNLFIISSGPVPPNPSELTALEKTGELIRTLRERYEYIIIDSSPIGVVSDTLYLASLADACMLIVKPGYTIRDMFEIGLNELIMGNTKGLCLAINDVLSSKERYGYGSKYGYTNNKAKRTTRRFLKLNHDVTQ